MNKINTSTNDVTKIAVQKPNDDFPNNTRGRRRISFSDEKGKQLEHILVR